MFSSVTPVRTGVPPAPANTFGTVRLLRALLAATLIVLVLLFAGVGWQERRVLMNEAARRADRSAEVLEQHAAAAFHTYLAAIDHEQLKGSARCS